jgi:hypothetical protein
LYDATSLDRSTDSKFGENVKISELVRHLGLQLTTEGMDIFNNSHQVNCCLGVAMLLCRAKYSRGDISNMVGECSQCMEGATMSSFANRKISEI